MNIIRRNINVLKKGIVNYHRKIVMIGIGNNHVNDVFNKSKHWYSID